MNRGENRKFSTVPAGSGSFPVLSAPSIPGHCNYRIRSNVNAPPNPLGNKAACSP